MSATLQISEPPTARPKPAPRRRRLTLEELVRKAAARIEQGPRKIVGTFRQVRQGRALTRAEKGFMALLAGGLSVAIWLHALPEPVSAHASHFRSLAGTHRIEVTAPRSFAESALQMLGRDWRAGSFFAIAAPALWEQGGAVHPNDRVQRVEQGLARLAAHGAIISLQSFPSPTAVETETIDGTDVLATRVAGQLELADGTVTRFAARLVQDPATKRWGLVELSVPGFLP
jgi:hypothetical protein